MKCVFIIIPSKSLQIFISVKLHFKNTCDKPHWRLCIFWQNALHLYHLFVNELDSKILDGYLNIGSFHLRIRDIDNDNRGDYDYQILDKFVT